MKKMNYEDQSSLFRVIMLWNGVVAQPVYNSGYNTTSGLFARSVNGIAVTWESFRDKSAAPAAFGRAMHAKQEIDATRAVVLCPVEDGPKDVMDDYARKYGVEWMTIEDFIEILRTTKPEISS